MTWNIEDARRAFERLEPQLEGIRCAIHRWLEKEVRDLHLVEPRVATRVKKPHSFVLKILSREREGRAWSDPLSESTDKVGGRVDVVFLRDVYRLREKIEAAGDVFEILKVEDKLHDKLDDDRLGYQGVHIDLRLHDLPDGIAPEHAVAEIQLRTHAQAAWSMAGHDLTYKAPVDLTTRQRRRMNRLTALLELFDEEVCGAVADMMGTEGYPVAIVIRALEEAWMRHVADRYNRALTRDIVSALVGDMTPTEAHQLESSIIDFEADHRSQLQEIYRDPFVGPPLKAQPESVLIFHELNQRPQQLQHRWLEAGLDYRLLDELATLWGARLATPR